MYLKMLLITAVILNLKAISNINEGQIFLCHMVHESYVSFLGAWREGGGEKSGYKAHGSAADQRP